MITEVVIVCIGTLISTIYHFNLRNLGIIGDHGRKGIHNNHTNLVTTVSSATIVAKANILTIARMVNLMAKSNQNEEDKHGNQRTEELRK